MRWGSVKPLQRWAWSQDWRTSATGNVETLRQRSWDGKHFGSAGETEDCGLGQRREQDAHEEARGGRERSDAGLVGPSVETGFTQWSSGPARDFLWVITKAYSSCCERDSDWEGTMKPLGLGKYKKTKLYSWSIEGATSQGPWKCREKLIWRAGDSRKHSQMCPPCSHLCGGQRSLACYKANRYAWYTAVV